MCMRHVTMSYASSFVVYGRPFCARTGSRRRLPQQRSALLYSTFLVLSIFLGVLYIVNLQQLHHQFLHYSELALSRSKAQFHARAPPIWKSYLDGTNHYRSDSNTTTKTLTVIFTADVHGNVINRPCTQQSQSQALNSCQYPGAPYLSTIVRTVRSQDPNALLLDVGDAAFGAGGSFESSLVAHTMNRLQYDAMALGNHELDLGMERLHEFVETIHFPVLASNAKLQGVQIQQHVILQVGDGETICVIGVTANEPNPLAGPTLRILSEMESVKRALSEVHAARTCTRSILLSHAGMNADQKMATEILQSSPSSSTIDAILGGHSHVLLRHQVVSYPESDLFGVVMGSTSNTDSQSPPGLIHVGANGRFVGLLRLTWDSVSKRLLNLQTEALPLDELHGVFPDLEFAEWQKRFIQEHSQIAQGPLSIRVRPLDIPSETICAQECRKGPCLLANIVTDSMRFCIENAVSCSLGRPEIVTNAIGNEPVIALLEAGTLRNCLNTNKPDFSIVLPWTNRLVLLRASGSVIREMLQFGATSKTGGGLLHASGLHHGNNLESEGRHRGEILIDLQRMVRPLHQDSSRDSNGAIFQQPLYSQLEMSQKYWLVVTDWLASGGDGFGPWMKKMERKIVSNVTLYQALLFSYSE